MSPRYRILCYLTIVKKLFLVALMITSFSVRRFRIRPEARSEQRSRVCVRRRQGAQRARARHRARHQGSAPVPADRHYTPRRRLGDRRSEHDGDYAGQLRATRLLARLLPQGRAVHKLSFTLSRELLHNRDYNTLHTVDFVIGSV